MHFERLLSSTLIEHERKSILAGADELSLVSMLGGALLISQFGAGPFSLDVRRSR